MLFSSPEVVLMVSFCDRLLSVIHRASCAVNTCLVNSIEATFIVLPIVMKFGQKIGLNDILNEIEMVTFA
jgi:hypothetical protein